MKRFFFIPLLMGALALASCSIDSKGDIHLTESYDCTLENSFSTGSNYSSDFTTHGKDLCKRIEFLADSLEFTDRDMLDADYAKDYFNNRLMPKANELFQPLLDSLSNECTHNDCYVHLKMTHSVFTVIGEADIK